MIEDIIEQAIDQSQEIYIYTGVESFAGRAIKLDAEFVQILCMSTESPVTTGLWTIRLSSITALSVINETWDDSRLDRIVNPEAQTIKPSVKLQLPDDDDSSGNCVRQAR